MMNLLLIISSADIMPGLIILLIGMGVIFVALIFMNLIFSQIPKLLKTRMRIRFRKAGKDTESGDCCADISGETNAAIALALHLYMNELHDMESNVVTIARVSRRYSPWSSKIYGLRNLSIRK